MTKQPVFEVTCQGCGKKNGGLASCAELAVYLCRDCKDKGVIFNAPTLPVQELTFTQPKVNPWGKIFKEADPKDVRRVLDGVTKTVEESLLKE